jgi:glutamate formiminotransferase
MTALIGAKSEALVQCVPNFSEGANAYVLSGITESIVKHHVKLVDWSADIDHNRSVFTFIGLPEHVKSAALSAATKATELIDIRSHKGVHPRLGAIDVLPFVPLRNITLEECALLAHDVGAAIACELNIPVFYYDAASAIGRSLPAVRKGAFAEFPPDVGPEKIHPTAGAVAIGARGPLIAFNVNLSDGSLALVKQIASDIRSNFTGKVRALGLFLPSRNMYQVSMNVVKPEEVDLFEIVEYIGKRSQILESELIGVMPGFNAFASLHSALKLPALRPEQILLETWPQNYGAGEEFKGAKI